MSTHRYDNLHLLSASEGGGISREFTPVSPVLISGGTATKPVRALAYPRLSGGQSSLETVPNTVGLFPSGALSSGHFAPTHTW